MLGKHKFRVGNTKLITRNLRRSLSNAKFGLAILNQVLEI